MKILGFERFSRKQMAVLGWWLPSSKLRQHDAIICDGAVRCGKTFCLSVSFLLWSFASFGGKDFAFCGKTIRSLHRNLVSPLLEHAAELGFKAKLLRSQNLIEVEYKGVKNRFHLFGGKDQGSAALIQGVTLGGVLFDEVALMPREFVEQALARCSVVGSKFWFNCNPEHPSHWFYVNWICKLKEKNAYYLHFEMEDNPALTTKLIQRYQSLYSGVFYQRYVQGRWVAAHGGVYPMFSAEKHVVEKLPEELSGFVISCDYGTVNPSSFGLWGYSDQEDCWYRIREFYHCSRTSGEIKTDEEYADSLEVLAGGLEIDFVVVDPSAASFIQCLRNRGRFRVVAGKNSVLDGIRLVSDKLVLGKLKFGSCCKKSIEEFSLYRWQAGSGRDSPVKADDHAMDDIRYFVMEVFGKQFQGVYAVATGRG